MTTLADIFDPAELAHCIAERLVVARKHPTRALTILNYTERCQYERGLWNPVTLACRGLIHDAAGNIIARPFRKFFNYGQSEAGTLDLTARCIATDKLDGSLGILYHDGAEWSIATRGSFESEQARHATALYRREYAPYFTPPDGWTLLFEIVYPENRIVLDYGEQDDLVLLGGVHIYGEVVGADEMWRYEGWTGPTSRRIGVMTLGEALELTARENAEGVVTRSYQTGEMLKIKQEDYVTLHRMIFGLNERAVWEHLKTNDDVSALVESLPDEFKDWAENVAMDLKYRYHVAHVDTFIKYREIRGRLHPSSPDFRKQFALKAREFDHPGWLFLLLDEQDDRLYDAIWDSLRPAHKPFSRTTTDTMETIAS